MSRLPQTSSQVSEQAFKCESRKPQPASSRPSSGGRFADLAIATQPELSVTSVQTAHVVPVRQCGKGGTPYLAWINPFLTTRRGVATTNRLDEAGVAAYAARCYSLSRRTTVGDPELKSGQRVWVADWRVPGRRRYGRTVRVDSSEILSAVRA